MTSSDTRRYVRYALMRELVDVRGQGAALWRERSLNDLATTANEACEAMEAGGKARQLCVALTVRPARVAPSLG